MIVLNQKSLIPNSFLFYTDDFKLVLERAMKVGLESIIITGGSLSESEKAIQIANTNDRLYATVGCHPTRVNEFDHYSDPQAYYDNLVKAVKNGGSKVVAIGECGLDPYFPPTIFQLKDFQLFPSNNHKHQKLLKKKKNRYFEKQFDLAETTRLPMFLHNRNTGSDFVTMIKQNRHRFTSGVVHSFTGSLEEMLELVNLDLYIGINGCSLKTEENLAVAKQIPENRLMIETDCPYCDIKKTHASYKYLHMVPQPQVNLEEHSGSQGTNDTTSNTPEKGKGSKDVVFDDNDEMWLNPLSKLKNKYQPGLMVKGRNEPFTIRQVLRVLANIRNQDETQLAHIVYENTKRVFFPLSRQNPSA
ncbi:putative deoxyribonuclease TATDN1 [Smittium culicis]|uniref:Putative deoxyribonuclease TATDN1 n=1 Tax=Smittium culicis TaxID=133412 RepID=A0A1R1YDM7_9FUNG|nr:putative deoxyribonuclease TATDN1 [Smittium culicis]